MIARATQLATVLAAAAALALGGCGSNGSDEPKGKKLPPSVTQELLQQLDSVSDRVAANVAGACDDIYSSDGGNIDPIDQALASIPSDVDPDIRSALEQSIDRLKELVDKQCTDIRSNEQRQQDTTTDETDTTPTDTTPTETETVPTETDTTPTETTTTPATPTTPQKQPKTTPKAPKSEGGGIEAPQGGE